MTGEWQIAEPFKHWQLDQTGTRVVLQYMRPLYHAQHVTGFSHGKGHTRLCAGVGAVVNSCIGKTSCAPELPKTVFPLLVIGRIDAPAVKPGIFLLFVLSHLLRGRTCAH